MGAKRNNIILDLSKALERNIYMQYPTQIRFLIGGLNMSRAVNQKAPIFKGKKKFTSP